MSIINSAASGKFTLASSGNYWRITLPRVTMVTTVEVRFTRSFVLTPQVTYGITSIKHGPDDKFAIHSTITKLNPAGFDLNIIITRSPLNKRLITVSYSWMAVGIVPEVPKIAILKPGGF